MQDTSMPRNWRWPWERLALSPKKKKWRKWLLRSTVKEREWLSLQILWNWWLERFLRETQEKRSWRLSGCSTMTALARSHSKIWSEWQGNLARLWLTRSFRKWSIRQIVMEMERSTSRNSLESWKRPTSSDMDILH